MSRAFAQRYRARFRKVLEHIESHLDSDLNVEGLSAVAAFSKYHFHRQFSALLGVAVCRYVQLRRLRRAAYQLAFRESKVLDIALQNGYEGPEAFSRAFKKAFGQSPSQFRRAPQWNPWHAIYQPLNELRAHYMKSERRADEVEIVHFEETRVAALEHRGDPRLLGDSVRRFIEWRKENGSSPQVSATFNIVYHDPDQVPPEDYRMDICAAIDHDVADNRFGVLVKTIPAGRCAVLRHVGSEDTLADTARYLYSGWLPQSGEEPRDFPLYFQRVAFYPDVPEHEAVTDVFLPLAPRNA